VGGASPVVTRTDIHEMISKSNYQSHFDLSHIGDCNLCPQGQKTCSSGNFYDYHIVSLCQQSDKHLDETQKERDGRMLQAGE